MERLSTRLTELLRIQHPILLAPMDIVADGRLAAAVSRAGGFGIIGGGYGDEAWLAREMDAAGDARVGVGFITWSMARRPKLLDMVLERHPPAVMLSFGDVQPHAQKIKSAGSLLICQVQTLEQAKDAVTNGADALVAQGAEAGGHGISRSTFPFVPAVVDHAPNTPVAAAGGIADGRGLAAALMLGADGVLMGTRFYASQEAAGMQSAKSRIVTATGDRTIRSILFDIARRNVWPAPYSGRVLQNEFSEKWRGREAELLQHQDEEAARYAAARAAGDFDTAAVIAGEVVDLIADIPSAAEIVERMMTTAMHLLGGASNKYKIFQSPWGRVVPDEPKSIAALQLALGGLPDRMRVEVDSDIEISAKTVRELRKVTVWPENLAIMTPQERYPESAVRVSKANVATRTSPKS